MKTVLTETQIESARQWLSELAWTNMDAEDFAEMPAHIIERGIEQHWDGGVADFILNCGLVA